MLTLKLHALDKAYQKQISDWQSSHFARRFWDQDVRLWLDNIATDIKRQDVKDRLGWLSTPHIAPELLAKISSVVAHADKHHFQHVVILGMGGSSLVAEVLSQAFSGSKRSLTVCDTTHPQTISRLTRDLPLEQTLFICASKSGSTLETIELSKHFYQQIEKISDDPQNHFIGISDDVEKFINNLGNVRCSFLFTSPENVGGRYAALTVFGLLPAALLGISLSEYLDFANNLKRESMSQTDLKDNPSFSVAAVLAAAYQQNRNRLSILGSPRLASFATWLEQLIAESTGKQGQGILPVPQTLPLVRSNDDRHLALVFKLRGDDASLLDNQLMQLDQNQQPYVLIELNDVLEIAAEFWRFKVVTAVVSVAIGVNPFDQPDVEKTKKFTRQIIDASSFPKTIEDAQTDWQRSKQELLKFLRGISDRYYLAIMAYVDYCQDNLGRLQQLKRLLEEKLFLTVTVGFGPRYLHSTGQFHKGGPDSGVFWQIFAVDQAMRSQYFAHLHRAQMQGDFQAITGQGRSILQTSCCDMDGLSTLLQFLKENQSWYQK